MYSPLNFVIQVLPLSEAPYNALDWWFDQIRRKKQCSRPVRLSLPLGPNTTMVKGCWNSNDRLFISEEMSINWDWATSPRQPPPRHLLMLVLKATLQIKNAAKTHIADSSFHISFVVSGLHVFLRFCKGPVFGSTNKISRNFGSRNFGWKKLLQDRPKELPELPSFRESYQCAFRDSTHVTESFRCGR